MMSPILGGRLGASGDAPDRLHVPITGGGGRRMGQSGDKVGRYRLTL